MRLMPYVPGLLLTLTVQAPYALGAKIATDPREHEEVYPDEELKVANKVADELIDQINKESNNHKERVFRDAHPRGIGCVQATFTVDANLEPDYQTPVFQPGKQYDAIIRYSSSLGPQGDNIPDARGMAIKLIGVKAGPKLLDDQADAQTHDFLQIDSPTFPAVNTEDFGGIVHIKTNPLLNALPFLLSHPIRHASELIAVAEGSFGNPNNGHSLAETQFFSMTPYLFQGNGDRIHTPAKFNSKPCASNFNPNRSLNGSGSELRDDLQDRIKGDSELCWDFGFQFYRENSNFNIESGMSEWTETASPTKHFATIRLKAGQNFLQDDKLRYCDNLSMQPWHAIAQHRPLGNLNRARKIIYEKISKSRHTSNNEMPSFAEPTSIDAFAGLNNPTYKAWTDIKVDAKANPGGDSSSSSEAP